MPYHPDLSAKWKPTAESVRKRLKGVEDYIFQVCALVESLDCLGEAKTHPEGSQEREFAQLRDELDFVLSRCRCCPSHVLRIRAETSFCRDLVVFALVDRNGDGPDALHLMRRYHALYGDESDSDDDEALAETFPDMFAWDTYLRVSALAELAKKYPRHIRHSARQMHGWPMIVSHHLDCRPEFQELAGLLQVGAEYPLNVSPRKKRGLETPLLRYLDPVLWRLHVFRKLLIEAIEKRWNEPLESTISRLWADFPDPAPDPNLIEFLKKLPDIPPLTKKTAPEWSRRVVVPYIMLQGSADRETCTEPALRAIWRHKGVKSPATFKSHLHSAIVDTLKRFARPG